LVARPFRVVEMRSLENYYSIIQKEGRLPHAYSICCTMYVDGRNDVFSNLIMNGGQSCHGTVV
jgi:hypothetical protein